MPIMLIISFLNIQNTYAKGYLANDYTEQDILNFEQEINNVSKEEDCWVIDSIIKSNPGLLDKKVKDEPVIANAVAKKKNGDDTTPPLCPNINQEESGRCSISGAVGWFLCPFADLISLAADGSWALLNEKLQTDHQLFNLDDIKGQATYQGWLVIRNLSNILFVFAMMLIIFSQLTNYGLSNYSVKKMLPKIIISIILVNLSFFIIQFLVDLSNISGDAVISLFDMQRDNILQGGNRTGSLDTFGSVVVLITGGIGTAHLAGITGEGFLSLVLPIIISFILIVVSTLIILLVRQSLVVLLTIMSPLFLTLMVFSKGEQAYKLWKKTLLACLMLYPSLAALFGAGKIISDILGEQEGLIVGLLSLFIKVAPLIMLPSLVQKMMASVPMIGNKLNNLMGKMRSGGVGLSKKTALYQNSAKKRENKMRDLKLGKSRKWGNGVLVAGPSNLWNKHTVSGRSRAAQLREEETNQIIKSGISFTESDNDYIKELNGDFSNIDLDRFSDGAKKQLASEGMIITKGVGSDRQYSINDRNKDKVMMMSALGEASRGNLGAEDVQNLLKNNTSNFSKDQFRSYAMALEKYSSNKGRFDTSGVIKGMLKSDNIKNWNDSDSINAIKKYYQEVPPDQFKNISHKAVAQNEDSNNFGAQAYAELGGKNFRGELLSRMSPAARNNIEKL